MKIFNTENDLQKFLSNIKKDLREIGFVPTMGALHSGHISLIKAAKEECGFVICSVFVNPTQFDKKEDLDKYPITIEEDTKMLEEADCDILFLPSVEEVYPSGKENYAAPDIGNIVNILEGKHRKGHFEGVMQVVERLLRMTTPTHLFMGLKDYQQFMICTKMTIAQEIDVVMRGMPIVREESGLAKSSRNVRLSEEGKILAANLHKRLKKSVSLLYINNAKRIEKKAKEYFDKFENIDLEYFEVVNKYTLTKPEGKNSKEDLIALMAAWIDGVRLIDNMELS